MDNRYYDSVIKEMKPFFEESGFTLREGGFFLAETKAAKVEYNEAVQSYELFVADVTDGEIGEYAFASCDSLVEFIVNSNLTKYAENTFDGCYYFGYDSVTINVPDNSGMVLAVIVGVFVVIGVVWYLVYNKKQKKIQKEIIEKNKLKELEAANKD